MGSMLQAHVPRAQQENIVLMLVSQETVLQGISAMEEAILLLQLKQQLPVNPVPLVITVRQLQPVQLLALRVQLEP